MKTILVLSLLAVAPLAATAVEAATYIAPEPRDSALLSGPAERGPQTFRIFLSKRTPEEVRAFYAATIGPIRDKPGSSNEAQSRVVLSYDQVLKILESRHRDLTLADDLSVSIRWKPAPAANARCMGDFFHDLMAIARMQKRQAEFDALCKQYGYLDNAFFQRVPDPHRPGQWIDADKVILARAHEQHGGQQTKALAASSADVAQRLQQLALSGRTAEAAALAAQFRQQAMQASGSATDWDAWVKVLREGDAAAYRTWILLPTHPSTW
jgi:hypothetical protein